VAKVLLQSVLELTAAGTVTDFHGIPFLKLRQVFCLGYQNDAILVLENEKIPTFTSFFSKTYTG
jgi:hypothetical protein